MHALDHAAVELHHALVLVLRQVEGGDHLARLRDLVRRSARTRRCTARSGSDGSASCRRSPCRAPARIPARSLRHCRCRCRRRRGCRCRRRARRARRSSATAASARGRARCARASPWRDRWCPSRSRRAASRNPSRAAAIAAMLKIASGVSIIAQIRVFVVGVHVEQPLADHFELLGRGDLRHQDARRARPAPRRSGRRRARACRCR